jgi:hypothetical protein
MDREVLKKNIREFPALPNGAKIGCVEPGKNQGLNRVAGNKDAVLHMQFFHTLSCSGAR